MQKNREWIAGLLSIDKYYVVNSANCSNKPKGRLIDLRLYHAGQSV